MRRNWLQSLVCVWTAGAVAVGGCRAPARTTTKTIGAPHVTAPATPTTKAAAAERAQVAIAANAGEDGVLTAKLATATVVSTGATVTELSGSETQALLARMEPLPAVSGKPTPIVRPPSLAPPRSGTTQPIAFITPGGKPIPDMPLSQAPAANVPLMAPQILPVGEITSESEIRVRFDEPMVAVAAVGTEAAVPATIKPAIAGSWRWIDTRVAMFTAKEPRLPKATEFTVTIAPGIRAISGATLATATTGTFSTPPVMINGTYPSVLLRPDSPVVVEFDQAIDPNVIVKYLRVETAKKKALAFKTVTLAEARALWKKNPVIDKDHAQIGANYVILAPKTWWPSGAELRVVLAKGAPSKEGPRVAADQTEGNFTIAPAFVVRGIICEDKKPKLTGQVCPANGWFNVQFSNDIEPKSYRSSKVQITGRPLDDHQLYGDNVGHRTPREVGRTFEIPVGDGIIDSYGQPLEGPRQLSFTTSREKFDPYMSALGGLYILDPRWEIPQWVVSTQAITTLRIQLYQVQPSDYFAFTEYERGERPTPPGKRVYDQEHKVGAKFGATARVDLRPALSAAGTGHVIAFATAHPATPTKDFDKKQSAWIQVSKLGITARFDRERLNAWTQDITPSSFLKPLPNVATSLLIEGRTDAPAAVKSDAEGHVTYDLLPELRTLPTTHVRRSALLLAHSGTDSVFTTVGHRYEKSVRTHHARWYVTDDRFTYKPGETVYVKGWVRWTHTGVNPDLALPPTSDTVGYTLSDSRGNKIGSGTAAFSKHGGFDLELTLPPNVNLGTAYFSFSTQTAASSHPQGHRHPISIQEFRTPAYAVNLTDDVTHSGATPLVLGESIEMSAEAKYYAGGGLGGSDIKWDASLQSASYRPPGWDLFTFNPVRKRSERSRYYGYRNRYERNIGRHGTSASQSGSLSGASTSEIVFGITALPAGEPSVLTVDATVTDIDRQTIRATSRSIVVHPSTLYVGIRQKPETRDTMLVVVTDIDGNNVPGVAVDVTIEGVLGSELYRDDANVIDTQHCKLTSAATPVPCTMTRKDYQTAYIAVAKIADSRGRTNAAQFFVPWWTTADKDLSVVADRQQYKPGDIAKLDVRSDIFPAVAVVSFARQGIIVQKRVELTQQSTIVEMPIEKAYIENVHVVVDRFGKRKNQHKGSVLPLPEHRQTQLDLAVDVESARLVMRTRATKALVEPGDEATFEVEVKRDDKPVAGAEVALIVVDEAILALSSKTHEDPLALFFEHVHDGTATVSTLGMVHDSGNELKGKPGFERWSLEERGYGSGTGSGYGVGGGRGGMSGRSASMPSVGMGVVKARKDFRPTAVFSPKLETDANGKVKLTVKMPDSLTRFRIIALATNDTRYFGKTENVIVTQRKVNARTVAPRFLTQGDAFSLPIVVQNLDIAPRTIEVAVRAGNLVGVGAAGKRVTVPGGQRAEVRFGFTTQSRGRAVIQTIAVSGEFADASNIELPVYEPATTESFATYGIVDDKTQFEQLKVPADIFPEVGGVEAEVASTQLQSLTDAFWYLYAYPFECAEQRSGRMLATSAMYDILDAFATPGRPTKKELQQQRVRDAKKLAKDQLADGGWGYFTAMKSDPFVTMQVLSALGAQKETGAVTKNAIGYVSKQANQLVDKLEKEAKTRDVVNKTRDEDAYRVSLAATGLATLASTGVDVAPRAIRLHTAATKLGNYPIDAKARVLAMIATQDRYKPVREKLLADLLSAVHETAAAATVTAKYTESERLLLVSNHKTTALAMDALIREAPNHALITKLARGLLDSRHRGRWRSTQENVVVLQAMRRYFDTYEKDTPNYTGKLWFGTSAYAEQSFVGRSIVVLAEPAARGVSQLDWATLKPGTTHDVAMQRDGSAGRMYYRIGITYAPKQMNLPPLDAGFVVRRMYKAVDDASDVVKLADGRWKVKLGARVLVQVEALNTTLRHAVALVDPLPAGFEIVNTNLKTSERGAVDTGADHWDHVNMRDNRSEAFSMHLDEGTHRFSYTARATTPGTFLAAPAKAEEMYSPETFGRSAGTTVVIE